MGAAFAATTLVALGHRIDMAMVIAVALGLLFIVLGAGRRESPAIAAARRSITAAPVPAV